ncbi:hypothetical protein V493_00677 [Pseudogymnoascus sp. VKM F-4281 (FW-2241)]|nr:hypothetical protein V493_00677 [Pseudogymnoascus sp. VKM F-4281 (FW-2241)]
MPHAVDDTDPVDEPPRPRRVDHEVEEWSNKLIGRKLGETTDETTVAMSDLPAVRRVIKPGYAYTLEYNHARINIKLDEDETVVSVSRG